MKPKSLIAENIYNNIPEKLNDEFFQTLFQNKSLRIERIVSKGHNSPVNEWNDQDWDEWILLIQGRARLQIDQQEMINLKPGDHLLLPAHQRHRVDWTDPDVETIWLAIHTQENL